MEHFPFRHIDKTQISTISQINNATDYIQVAGIITDIELMGVNQGRRLVARLKDKTGSLDLIWFQSLSWVQKNITNGNAYLVYGKVGFFLGQAQIVHPEIEPYSPEKSDGKPFLDPIYPSTEKLKSRSLNGRQIGVLTKALWTMIHPKDLQENLPARLLEKLKLLPRFEAYQQIHFPASSEKYSEALRRLKFEELFFAQLRLGLIKTERHRFSKGVIFDKVGDHFNNFYHHHLPFQLTGAQKRVLREIRQDTAHGRQMNRLLQGDVGSGKTIVALLAMLLAIDNGYQACLMAPTEILAQQHLESISGLLAEMDLRVELLTGSTKAAARRKCLAALANGDIHVLIGTHALIEDVVQFKNLGFAIVDEQHRFGVAQRAKLWSKAIIPPHVLVMTATPIPRTLAMTAYGDLDYSVMDELPPGRQPITTVHRLDDKRSQVMDFIKEEISKGRQVYIIFPLIEESEKLDYENLMKGYENVKAYFPEPKYLISMVHGKQPAEQKEINMQRFVKGETQIMVSTTVIEVGVNVPNASVMVIESAEKFGLSQLHQLRGRVGRGSEKSFCILLTGSKLSNEARERMKIITSTNDGFIIAEKDLELRGPGSIDGTKQSGALNFKLANIIQDKPVLDVARQVVEKILEEDPDLLSADYQVCKSWLFQQQGKTAWSRIS